MTEFESEKPATFTMPASLPDQPDASVNVLEVAPDAADQFEVELAKVSVVGI